MVYVDSEGLSDGRSIKNTVLNLAPKMLIVTGGSRRAKANLVSHVRKLLDGDGDSNDNQVKEGGGSGGVGGGGVGSGIGGGGSGEGSRYVVVDKVLEPLPVGLDSGAFDVLLHDSLHTQLKWKQVFLCLVCIFGDFRTCTVFDILTVERSYLSTERTYSRTR